MLFTAASLDALRSSPTTVGEADGCPARCASPAVRDAEGGGGGASTRLGSAASPESPRSLLDAVAAARTALPLPARPGGEAAVAPPRTGPPLSPNSALRGLSLASRGKVGYLENPTALLQVDGGRKPRLSARSAPRAARAVTDFLPLLDDAEITGRDERPVPVSVVAPARRRAGGEPRACGGPGLRLRTPSPHDRVDDGLDDDDDDDEGEGGGGRRASRAPSLDGAEPPRAEEPEPRSRILLLAVSESLKRRYDFYSWPTRAEAFVPRASVRGGVSIGGEYRTVVVDDAHMGEAGFRATYGAALVAFYREGGLVIVLTSSAALGVPSAVVSPLFGVAAPRGNRGGGGGERMHQNSRASSHRSRLPRFLEGSPYDARRESF